MEYSLVINFQFCDKKKQEKVYSAFSLYKNSNFDEFSKAIDIITGKTNTLNKYPSLTPEAGPESITKLTRAGNTIAYFICGSSDGEEKGSDLRSLLTELGAAKFKGYLESDKDEFSVWNLIYEVKSKNIGCVSFSEDELLSAMKTDNRFSVVDTYSNALYAKIYITS
jgi:hypothetical protein